MRLEYTNILDEMVANNKVINQYIDGRNLLSYLQVYDVINYQERVKLHELGPMECTQHLIKVVLKPKKDEDMIHFLNSLRYANYDDAYNWLKGKLEDIILKMALNNLTILYEKRLKFVESYWRQFGVKGNLNMETFYNHNIVISNEKYKQIQKKIENFDDMFSTEYERIIVMAETGYGKSTFVHEMARQWAKGDKEWTRKFRFLFLFRLTEVNENESKSLENLLSLCLCHHDASKVYKWLKDGNMSKALFIFDGLDELRQNFCQEVNELIFGGKVNLATVAITSRQCQKLTDIKEDMQSKLYIELKGFTNEGVVQQLEKFSIPTDGVKKDLKNHLKIPLFNTIFCITHSESRIACTNICSSIHSFVNFAINRYRNSNHSFTVSCKEQLLLTLGQAAQNIFSFTINRYRNSNHSFTVSCKEQLLLTLGQAAQNKFSFIKGVAVPYPNVSLDHLFWAVKSGLLHSSSSIEDLMFAHQTIAEYCAAYFWCKTSRFAIKECDWGTVTLNEPPNAQIYYLQPFSQFVCYLCPEFKEGLWRKFVWYVPIFDEYENLPVIRCKGRTLRFSSHSVDDQDPIINKLNFQENNELILIKGHFEPEKLFKTIRKLKKLSLIRCTFNIGAEEFFIHFTNVQSLRFEDCEFYDLNVIYDDLDLNKFNPPHLPLQKLQIFNCSVEIETVLSFIMKYSTFMKSFEFLTRSFHYLWKEDVSPGEEKHSKNVSIGNGVNDCGIDWISELQNNKHLCVSIENCKLWFAHPFTMIQIIETFKIMQNLKKLNLTVLRKLTKLEANALADLLKDGLFVLNNINLNIKMENQEDYKPVLKNLSKLSALTSLHLWNTTYEIFTTDTLNYLADIFNNLKLEECGLEYQEIFFEERTINSINSCLSLKNITLWTKKMEDSDSKLFKKGIKNKDRQLRIKNFHPRFFS